MATSSERDRRYRTSLWRKRRAAALRRDRWRCMLAYRGCEYTAPGSLWGAPRGVAAAHHKTPPRTDAEFFDVAGIVACCRRCNTLEKNVRAAVSVAAPSPAPSSGWVV